MLIPHVEHPPSPRGRAARLLGALLAGLAATALGATLLVAAAGTAHAEDGYRYWHYYHLQDGAWAFATQGPGQSRPEDGSVEGFRFGASTMQQPLEPRADLSAVTFEAICDGVAAEDGQKRVALVVDYGTEADSQGSDVPQPTTACAVVEQSGTTQQALDSVADVRVENGLVCAVDGYPASGCGESVPDVTVPADEPTVAFALPADAESASSPTASDPSDEDGNGAWWGLGAIAAVAVLLGVGALLASRRRNRTT